MVLIGYLERTVIRMTLVVCAHSRTTFMLLLWEVQAISFGEWAWPDKLTYFFTSQRDLVSDNEQVKFLHDNPERCIEIIRHSAKDKNIWLLGGAHLAHTFFSQKIIDEIILTVIPASLGSGIKLNIPYSDFDLVSEIPCADRTIQRKFLKKCL